MSDSNLNPPKGNFQSAEKYINQLVELLNQKSLEVFHTDLKKFDPTSLQNHYVINLKDYQIEVSHSKQPNTGKDSFVMIFNNFKNIADGKSEKVILAYVYLPDDVYAKFKIVADRQIEDRRRIAEEKRFNEVMIPFNNQLDQISTQSSVENSETPKPEEDGTSSSNSYLSEQQIHQI